MPTPLVRHGQLLIPPAVAERARKQNEARSLEKRIAYEVWKHYPSHTFMFEVDARQGYVYIDHALLQSNKARYFVRKSDGIGAVIKMCGEILERAGIERGALRDFSIYDDAAATAKDAFKAR